MVRVKNADGKSVEIDIFFEKRATKGRPKKILTPEAVKLIENLASIMCTEEEIANCLETTPDTLHNAENDDLFRSAIKKGQSQGKQSLRREQWKLAQKGNASMLIWLGKQWLGQTDKIETEVSSDGMLDKILDYMEKYKDE